MTSFISNATSAASYLYHLPSSIWQEVNSVAADLDQKDIKAENLAREKNNAPIFQLPVRSGTAFKTGAVSLLLLTLSYSAKMAGEISGTCSPNTTCVNIDRTYVILLTSTLGCISYVTFKQLLNEL